MNIIMQMYKASYHKARQQYTFSDSLKQSVCRSKFILKISRRKLH